MILYKIILYLLYHILLYYIIIYFILLYFILSYLILFYWTYDALYTYICILYYCIICMYMCIYVYICVYLHTITLYKKLCIYIYIILLLLYIIYHTCIISTLPSKIMKEWLGRHPPPNLLQSEQRRPQMGQPSRPNHRSPASNAVNVRSGGPEGVFSRNGVCCNIVCVLRDCLSCKLSISSQGYQAATVW